MKRLWVIAGVVILLGVCGFGALQLVPYGRDQVNPPILREPQWTSQQTRTLAKRACFDCHSNEVVWPWYAKIAPVSWLVYRDVVKGRDELNFSEWSGREKTEELIEKIQEGSMPPRKYLILHPAASLSAAEKQQLITGLQQLSGRH